MSAGMRLSRPSHQSAAPGARQWVLLRRWSSGRRLLKVAAGVALAVEAGLALSTQRRATFIRRGAEVRGANPSTDDGVRSTNDNLRGHSMTLSARSNTDCG